MIENKKYYNSLGWWFVFVVLFSTAVILFLIPLDYGNKSIKMFSAIDWMITCLLGTFNLIVLAITIQVKRKKSFIYFKDDILYMSIIFGKTRSINLLNDFDYEETKGKLKYVVLKDNNGKTKILIGSGYDIPLDEVKAFLDSYKIEKSTLS